MHTRIYIYICILCVIVSLRSSITVEQLFAAWRHIMSLGHEKGVQQVRQASHATHRTAMGWYIVSERLLLPACRCQVD